MCTHYACMKHAYIMSSIDKGHIAYEALLTACPRTVALPIRGISITKIYPAYKTVRSFAECNSYLKVLPSNGNVNDMGLQERLSEDSREGGKLTE